jgi:hypothetical protein
MARQLKDLADTQAAVRELLDFQEKLKLQSWDMRGNRITNAAEGKEPNDYVTVSQLPVIKDNTITYEDIRTIYFCSGATVAVGDLIPVYKVGRGQESTLVEVLLEAVTLPVTDSLKINLMYRLNGAATPVSILQDDLELTVGATEGVFTSKFVVPTIKLARYGILYPTITQSGGDGADPEVGAAGYVSIGIVVKRII